MLSTWLTMKHAGTERLVELSPYLDQLRAIPELREKSLGVFYRKSRAFLHFHEDGANTFADVRLDGSEFERYPCSTESERNSLLKAIRKTLSCST